MSTVATPPPREEMERGQSLSRDAWHRLRKNRLAVFGGVTLIIIVLSCFLGPLFSRFSYDDQKLDLRASPPRAKIVEIFDSSQPNEPRSWTHLARLREEATYGVAPLPNDAIERLARGESVTHENRMYKLATYRFWLGTDTHGRDLLVRILQGGRISVLVGLVATAVALVIGVGYGAVAGYIGGKLDAVMMRIVDVIYALPFTIFVILLMVLLKEPSVQLDQWLAKLGWFDRTQGMGNMLLIFATIGAVEWLTMARIVRGQVMALKQTEFVEAARSLGFSKRRIIFNHILPNILGPVIVYTTLTIPAVMMLEAFLSFLGLGVQPPMSSWGVLIKEGAEKMEEFPWLLIYPAAAFSLTLFSLNFLGDGLRDALDVRSSKD
jgi:oligopeptide transport system permease protein